LRNGRYWTYLAGVLRHPSTKGLSGDRHPADDLEHFGFAFI
jgi:hypothetical protein